MLKLKINDESFEVDKMLFDGPRANFGIQFSVYNEELRALMQHIMALQIQDSKQNENSGWRIQRFIDVECDKTLYTKCFVRNIDYVSDQVQVHFTCNGEILGGYENANI